MAASPSAGTPVVPSQTQRGVRLQAGRGVLRRLHATELLILGFAAVITVGTVLLSLPVATRNRVPLHFVDALFTAVSATCVTGHTRRAPPSWMPPIARRSTRSGSATWMRRS